MFFQSTGEQTCSYQSKGAKKKKKRKEKLDVLDAFPFPLSRQVSLPLLNLHLLPGRVAIRLFHQIPCHVVPQLPTFIRQLSLHRPHHLGYRSKHGQINQSCVFHPRRGYRTRKSIGTWVMPWPRIERKVCARSGRGRGGRRQRVGERPRTHPPPSDFTAPRPIKDRNDPSCRHVFHLGPFFVQCLAIKDGMNNPFKQKVGFA